MFSKDLLVTRKGKGKIYPKYLQDIGLAEKLITLFKSRIGKKYKVLNQNLDDLEQNEKAYKVIRGLSTLLERRCEFKTFSKLESKDVRKFLFERGFVPNEDERKIVLEEASNFFNTSKEKVEEAMFSDLLEEQLLKSFNPISPLELIKIYNLSSIQTLLFDALELTFHVEGNYQQIFRQINYLGLMYEIENDEVKITGPASLFKKTRKYGTSLAKLLTYIINNDKWQINAKIETKWGNEPRIYNFELNSSDEILLPDYKKPITPFDSEVEAQFYREFKNYNSGWEIKREPTFIKAGNYVTIPDFGFYKHEMKYYLEIVGFWTPEYLEKKIRKLNNVNVNVMVAVNQKLNCKKDDFPGDVIFYNKKIPIKPIIKFLKEVEENYIQREIDKLEEIKLKKDIITLKEKAKELSINPEVLERVKIPNYIIIEDKIVSKQFLENVKTMIGNERDYNKVKKILEKNRLTTNALEHMGYKLVWKDLIPIKIVKK